MSYFKSKTIVRMFPIGARIACTRYALGMKQRELAKISRVCQSLIDHLEQERRTCSEAVAKRITNALKKGLNK
jgi:predicted transcriptional regulator